MKTKRRAKSALANKVQTYLNDNYRKSCTLSLLTERFHRSPNYISRSFVDTYGITVTKYLNHVRVENAKELLRDTDMTLFCMADLLGYSSERYFIKVFRDFTGMTPGEYRCEYGR